MQFPAKLSSGSIALAALLLGSCTSCGPREGQAPGPGGAFTTATPSTEDPQAIARADMVQQQIAARGVSDARVLAAMRTVPREEFIPAQLRALAYADRPLPIEHRQTISQPYIVAIMTELAGVDSNSVVLEIGTGSGYQAAVLAEIAHQVFSIEIIAPLAHSAEATLARLGYDNVHVRHGDGYRGWPEEAPFDAIIVTAAPPSVPEPLRQQLTVGGRLVVPVGTRYQELRVIERTVEGYSEHSVLPVRFVPMTGEAQVE